MAVPLAAAKSFRFHVLAPLSRPVVPTAAVEERTEEPAGTVKFNALPAVRVMVPSVSVMAPPPEVRMMLLAFGLIVTAPVNNCATAERPEVTSRVAPLLRDAVVPRVSAAPLVKIWVPVPTALA